MQIGTNRDSGELVELPTSILNKNFAMLGSVGSGKTVAAKILIEEATLNGIPSVIVDPQGDLARLAIIGDRATVTEKGGDAERSRSWEEKAEVRIWTPTKESGLPICLDRCVVQREEDREILRSGEATWERGEHLSVFLAEARARGRERVRSHEGVCPRGLPKRDFLISAGAEAERERDGEKPEVLTAKQTEE